MKKKPNNQIPDLEKTIFVGAWLGWSDATKIATRAIREIISQASAKKFYSIEPEEFYDFSQNRPTVKNRNNGKREIKWPSNNFYYINTDKNSRDIVLFLGVEPNYKWQTYSREIFDIAKTVNTEIFVTLGALLDSVPHTRKPKISCTTTANDIYNLYSEEYKNTLKKEDYKKNINSMLYTPPSYEGPCGLTSVLGQKFDENDIETISIWGHAPHYLQITHNPTLTFTVLKELTKFLDIELDLEQLEVESDEFRANLENALEDQKDIEIYIKKLEERFDSEEHTNWLNRTNPEPAQLVKELEDFLKKERDSGEQSL